MAFDDSAFDPASYAGDPTPSGLLSLLMQTPAAPKKRPPFSWAPQSPAAYPGQWGAPASAPTPPSAMAPASLGMLAGAPLGPPSSAGGSATTQAAIDAEMPSLTAGASAPDSAAAAPPDSAGAPGPAASPAASYDTTPSGVPSGSLLSRLGEAINAHPNVLLALGAGMAGSHNIGEGISRAFGGAIPAAQMDVKTQRENVTVEALKKKGVPEDVAKSAVGNKDLMASLIQQYWGPKQYRPVVTKGPFGEEQINVFNPVTGQTFGPDGKPVGNGINQPNMPRPSSKQEADALPKGTVFMTPEAASTQGFYAPGVSKIDSALEGDDYLKQFSPEVRAAVKKYVGGESMPTGNPRQGFAQTIKMIAQKYGDEVGMPADDSTFVARRKMRDQLSSGTLSSLGGQINTGNTAIGHLSDLSDKALALHNVWLDSLSWLPGSAALAHGVNAVGNSKASNSDTVNGFNDARERYVQEITKFYSGSPGAQAERDRAIAAFDAARTPKELAAAIGTEAELMHSKLQALGSQIGGVLGPMAADYPVIRPESGKALDRIDKNVAALRGDVRSGAASREAAAVPGAPSPAAAASSSASPSVPSPSIVPQHVQQLPISEQMRNAPDGSIVRFGQQRLIKQSGKWQPVH